MKTRRERGALSSLNRDMDEPDSWRALGVLEANRRAAHMGNQNHDTVEELLLAPSSQTAGLFLQRWRQGTL